MDKTYRILVINPGSTSTKLSMFENETCLFTEDVFHDSSVLKRFPTINDQLDYRMEVVDKFPSVKSVQSVFRGYPYEAISVLIHFYDSAA